MRRGDTSAIRALERNLDRRQLLASLAASAAMLAGHDAGASGPSGSSGRATPDELAGSTDEPRILALRLLTATPLAEMKSFYGRTLELPVRAESDDELVIGAGSTEITFVRATDGQPPFYHFAFNVPENKILAARGWQLERTELFITPPNLRDPAFPNDVRHFRSWNAHSVFFWDPAGNVLEYIARHDLGNATEGAFGPRDVLYASEIGFVVDDVPAAAAALQADLGIGSYRAGSEQFWANGDERGLLLLFKRGREIGDVLRGRPSPVGVFETRAEIAGAAAHDVPGYPYRIVGTSQA